jgi:hypothetical protein
VGEIDRACSAHGEKRNAYRIMVGRPEGKRQLGRSRHKGRIILIWISEIWDGVILTGLMWFRIGVSIYSCCERGNEPSGFIKCREVLE